MVRDAHLAEDVAQGVFVALAQNAARLTDRPVLSGWLHRTAQNLAANVVRSEVRRRAREQEAAAMNELHAAELDTVWEQITPLLDAALGELNDADRDALLLRFFERKSAREMAQTLGTSEDAAQKRVSRAVERLRECFAKRGVTVGASGLAVAVSANAVQAAPIGLSGAISTAAASAIAWFQTSTGVAAKVLTMTTLTKGIVAATLAAAIGAGIYEARQASFFRDHIETLQEQQDRLAEQVLQLGRERDEATNRLAKFSDYDERVRRDTAELAQLRGEIAKLRRGAEEPVVRDPLAAAVDVPSVNALDTADPSWRPNWIGLEPLDLAQFRDLSTNWTHSLATDVGQATPAALLQTWNWAHRTGDATGILKTWDFPNSFTEEEKLA